MAEDEDKYDLFVSYAEADSEWVRGYLLPELSRAGVRWHSEEAFRLGVPRIVEFERVRQQSLRTLLVLSPAYMDQQLLKFLEIILITQAAISGEWRVIPLILQPVGLPSWLAVLMALDATDPDDWPTILGHLLVELKKPLPEPLPPPPCPYPGLRQFAENEGSQFYGRQRVVEEMLERLFRYPFLAILGSSGSGKSSLVHAGFIPQLKISSHFASAKWRVLDFRPGPQPIQQLAATLNHNFSETEAEIEASLMQDPTSLSRFLQTLVASAPHAHCLLFIDQFEEVFAQCNDISLRRQFLTQLSQAIESRPERCLIVLAVRSDFYGDCQESLLWPHVEANLLNLPPLSSTELRLVITQPATEIGVYLEPVLVERLIADAAEEEGALPLLQATLVSLWTHVRSRRVLTVADYEALGRDGRSGLQVALARQADAALAALASDAQRTAIARRIFIRLIELGDRRNTRRQQQKVALSAEADSPRMFEEVLEYLISQRLLIASTDEHGGAVAVDLAHEKLIDAWPRLAKWLEAFHGMEEERRSLELAATAWKENGKNRAYLFVGDRLGKATTWAAEWHEEVSVQQEEFLAESYRWDKTLRRRQPIAILIGVSAVIVVVILYFVGQGIHREIVRRTVGTVMAPMEGGATRIGTNDVEAYPEEQPERTLSLLAFQIEQFEVSNDQYRACVRSSVCEEPTIAKDEYMDERRGTFPVVGVSAIQANVYCRWIGRRLPTSVEWERAARGRSGRVWPWGEDDPLPGQVQLMLPNYPGYQPDGPVPVDSMPAGATPKPDSIYHLADNVREWVVIVAKQCQEAACHDAAWNGKAQDVGIMGGDYAGYLDRITEISVYSADAPEPTVGFRCAR